MNVFLQRFFFVFLAALFTPLLARAQNTVWLTTFQDVPVEYAFTSTPNDPSVTQMPVHGTFQLVESPPLNYTLTYTPDAGFIGSDQMRMVIWNSPASFSTVTINISVQPSFVEAVHDFAFTPLSTPISINVLENDISNTGIIYLKSIPLVNNGVASFSQGSEYIDFTPDPDFEGIAYLNYVVCDDIGTCDDGTVSIIVYGPSATVSDTMRIFTKKNLSQVVLVPDFFTLVSGPANGTFDNSGEFPEYQPSFDFVGMDYIVFEYNDVVKVVEIDVMDVVENVFAVDDRIYMTSHQGTIEYNVLENDAYGPDAGCFYVGQAQFGTAVKKNNAGEILYTPPAGFFGVDWFTYTSKPPMCSGPAEIATVYVFVSNYEPAASRYRLSTPKQTPLVLEYGAPVTNFLFTLTASPDLGEVLLLPGQVDTVLFGQEISGYNLIIYNPDPAIASGFDEFEIDYCVLNTGGTCSFTKTVKIEVDILDIGSGNGPQCFDDCVWAGDTNRDGIVNMEDLLPIGLAIGAVGKPRPEADMSAWYGQYGEDWNAAFLGSGFDLKYLDANGDSIVSALDTAAISQFYGRTHNLNPRSVPFYENEIVLEGNIFAEPGDLIELKMMMGSPDSPAVDVYGFTFPFAYNPDIFIPATVEIDYYNQSWLSYNSPVLKMVRNDLEGLIESGFTRTSGIAASGRGEIGAVRFVVTDNIDGLRGDGDEIVVNVGQGVATGMNGAGQTFGVNVKGVDIHIRLRPQDDEAEDRTLNPDLLKVYPNPSRDILNIHLNGRREFERARIFNLMGQMVFDSGRMVSNRAQLNVSILDNGLYFLSVNTPEGVITKKFEVVK
jgi:hypothetical protein